MTSEDLEAAYGDSKGSHEDENKTADAPSEVEVPGPASLFGGGYILDQAMDPGYYGVAYIDTPEVTGDRYILSIWYGNDDTGDSISFACDLSEERPGEFFVGVTDGVQNGIGVTVEEGGIYIGCDDVNGFYLRSELYPALGSYTWVGENFDDVS